MSRRRPRGGSHFRSRHDGAPIIICTIHSFGALSALIDRHANHREFINELFDREDLMAFFRGKMLDEVYERLRAESPGQ